MRLHVQHRTTFRYNGPAQESFNEVRLRPLDDLHQSCQEFTLHVTPRAKLTAYQDFYGNCVHYFEVPGEHEELVIDSCARVLTHDPQHRPAIPLVPASALASDEAHDSVAEYCTHSPYVGLDAPLWKEAQDALAGGRADVWSDVRRLAQHLFRLMRYQPGSTGIDTRASDALQLRRGVCQDYAHVMLGLCRSIGIPARYVSGYFLNETRRAGEPEASHAWVEAFVPTYGWAGWDPTHDRAPDERYVRLAIGRDYTDIRPVNGSYRGAPARELRVEVTVREETSVASG